MHFAVDVLEGCVVFMMVLVTGFTVKEVKICHGIIEPVAIDVVNALSAR